MILSKVIEIRAMIPKTGSFPLNTFTNTILPHTHTQTVATWLSERRFSLSANLRYFKNFIIKFSLGALLCVFWFFRAGKPSLSSPWFCHVFGFNYTVSAVTSLCLPSIVFSSGRVVRPPFLVCMVCTGMRVSLVFGNTSS